MRLAHALGLTTTALLAALLPAAATTASDRPGQAAVCRPAGAGDRAYGDTTCVRYGTAAPLGRGRVRVYTEHTGTTPRTLGIALTARALTGLPTVPTDGAHCHDADRDGRTDAFHECVGGHGRELALPRAGGAGAVAPFQWALVNWNPHGHSPHGRYDVPHFDAHFYLVPRSVREGIRLGSCALLVDCRQLPVASRPVPAAQLPAGYPASTPETAEGAMGEHLDSRPPTSGPLTGHTLIYGAYDGEIIFVEPMLTKDSLERLRTASRHEECAPVPQPRAWRLAGWYPTRYCLAYRPHHGDFTVGLTGFVHRTPATSPATRAGAAAGARTARPGAGLTRPAGVSGR
ncbi:hypothetical protein NX801_04485 [Streptomyces sp. LP05-1]|uniref:DUF5602 domain-containing protein n=1 Tax=Streptomyces pyxinae TaxID=2970734 RepID=A0ABT2CBY8_9ACTN|nr:hypothetical protein [Streptomyces sp. LP05-1]MCS0634929.1 hypothetical protein [Streptomyces sp. LP05-1]